MIILLLSLMIHADSVRDVASVNGFKPTDRIVNAIERAAYVYDLDVNEMTAIAIVETGLGKAKLYNLNVNKTVDVGLYQVNSINHHKCLEYNLYTPEGNSLCAAKLLFTLKKQYPNSYLGMYHSKTPSHKEIYLKKIRKILNNNKKRYIVQTGE